MSGTVRLDDDAAKSLPGEFDARYRELGIAETVALPPSATITPHTLLTVDAAASVPQAWTQPDPALLPRLSLSFDDANDGARATATTRSDLEVKAVIGEGGMGRVHAARQRSLEREVAIKTTKDGAVSGNAVGALLREAVITGSLEHPGIVPVHVLGLDAQGAPVLVMKRVEGAEWRALLVDPAHPAWKSRPADRVVAHVEILMQVCQAVHFAHSRGVIHRDIKPENVMVGDFGEVYLVDWGIALRSDDPSARDGMPKLVGTPGYMAPEMVSGGALGPWTDVYLLGATLHEVLTGVWPHRGDTLREVLLAAFCSEPVEYGADVPAELAALCHRAMARDPTERPESALAFRQALSDFLTHRGSIALAQSAQERFAALKGLLLAAGDGVPAELQTAYRLATEARFGFTQAVKEWSDNALAKDGLRECVCAAVDLELRQGHAATAAALLDELERPPHELVAALERVKKDEARRNAEQRRLRQLDQDLDASIAGKQRTRGLAALAGVGAAIGAFAMLGPSAKHIRPEALVVFALVLLATLGLTFAFWRNQLLRNAFNRRLFGVVVLATGVLVLNRVFGTLTGIPVPWILVLDLLLLTSVAAAAAITLVPRLWLVPMVLVPGLVGCMVWPGQALLIFGIASLLAIPACILALHRHLRDERLKRADELPESRVSGERA